MRCRPQVLDCWQAHRPDLGGRGYQLHAYIATARHSVEQAYERALDSERGDWPLSQTKTMPHVPERTPVSSQRSTTWSSTNTRRPRRPTREARRPGGRVGPDWA